MHLTFQTKKVFNNVQNRKGSVFEILHNKGPTIKDPTQFSFAPKINQISQSMRRSRPVSVELYERGMNTINRIKNLHETKLKNEIETSKRQSIKGNVCKASANLAA